MGKSTAADRVPTNVHCAFMRVKARSSRFSVAAANSAHETVIAVDNNFAASSRKIVAFVVHPAWSMARRQISIPTAIVVEHPRFDERCNEIHTMCSSRERHGSQGSSSDQNLCQVFHADLFGFLIHTRKLLFRSGRQMPSYVTESAPAGVIMGAVQPLQK